MLSEEELVNRALTLAQVVYPITSSEEDYNAMKLHRALELKKLSKKFPILHIKCGAHTLELLIDALSSHYKGLDATIEMGRAMVVKINNAKCLLKQFIDIQRRIDPEKQPLSLVLLAVIWWYQDC